MDDNGTRLETFTILSTRFGHLPTPIRAHSACVYLGKTLVFISVVVTSGDGEGVTVKTCNQEQVFCPITVLIFLKWFVMTRTLF